jgi:hypothetical protein
MSVYLGAFGDITLRRSSASSIKESIVNPGDINAVKRRFSFDFDSGYLITGDQLEITSTDGTTLDFIDATGWRNEEVQSSGKWFINVDELGGIKLYEEFDASLTGNTADAVPLLDIVRNIPIKVEVENVAMRQLGQVINYELNTNRDVIDITAMAEEFRSQWSGLMSGSGRVSCLWDYRDTVGGGAYETVNYLMQLALRTEIGSEFDANLYIKTDQYHPDGGESLINDALWYEIRAVVTQAAIQFQAGDVVQATIDFITTGIIRLKTRTQPKRYLLQEDGGKISLEQDAASFLLLEEPE